MSVCVYVIFTDTKFGAKRTKMKIEETTATVTFDKDIFLGTLIDCDVRLLRDNDCSLRTTRMENIIWTAFGRYIYEVDRPPADTNFEAYNRRFVSCILKKNDNKILSINLRITCIIFSYGASMWVACDRIC